MREIVLDTETTGLEHELGHRIIEIGAVELISHIPTGKHYHVYINPEREIDARASEVHGITIDQLADKPVFADIADGFLDFVRDSTLVIHNASFDMGFINAELRRLEKPVISNEQVIDTLMMARKKYPGGQASLDALCKKFGVDNSGRDLHGALIDADLLALVYIELIGGKQPDLMGGMAQDANMDNASANAGPTQSAATRDSGHRPRRDFPEHADERAAHQHFIGMMENPLWDKYQS
jgi:DNA polymerase-3 subunit epsilon